MEEFTILQSKFVGDKLFRLCHHRYDIDVPTDHHAMREISYIIQKRVFLGFYITIRKFSMEFATCIDHTDDINNRNIYIKNLAEDAFDALTAEIL